MPVDTQPEMRLMAEAGEIPAELDHRLNFKNDVRSLVHKARDYGIVHPVTRFNGFTFK
jgi:hypothetical protein